MGLKFGGTLSGCFWLWVCHKVAVKMLAGNSVILTKTGGSASKKAHSHGYWQEVPIPLCWLLVEGFSFSPHVSHHRVVDYFMTWQLASPRAGDTKQRARRKPSLCSNPEVTYCHFCHIVFIRS